MCTRNSCFKAFLIVMLVAYCGCSPKYNQPLGQTDLSSLGPITVVRYETPGMVKSTPAETSLLALITIAAPGGSALFFVGDAYGKARGAGDQALIPDFGAVVMDRFAEGVDRLGPRLPRVTVLREPLKEDFSPQTTVIELDVKRLAYGSIDLTRGGIVFDRGLEQGIIAEGFLSKTVATMKTPQGDILWQKSFTYLSQDFDRAMSLDDLEANQCNLLKEEVLFAAEMTMQDFIAHLTGTSR